MPRTDSQVARKIELIDDTWRFEFEGSMESLNGGTVWADDHPKTKRYREAREALMVDIVTAYRNAPALLEALRDYLPLIESHDRLAGQTIAALLQRIERGT